MSDVGSIDSAPTRGKDLEPQRGARANWYLLRLTGNGRSLPVMVSNRAAQGWSIKCNDAHFFIPLIATVFQV
jgi:hypothetical protein